MTSSPMARASHSPWQCGHWKTTTPVGRAAPCQSGGSGWGKRLPDQRQSEWGHLTQKLVNMVWPLVFEKGKKEWCCNSIEVKMIRPRNSQRERNGVIVPRI